MSGRPRSESHANPHPDHPAESSATLATIDPGGAVRGIVPPEMGRIMRSLATVSHVFDAAGAAVFAYDRRGQILYANDIGEQNMRSRPNAPEQVIGAPLAAFYDAANADAFIERLNAALDRDEKSVLEYTTEFAGALRTFVTTILPDRSPDGDPARDVALVIAREITIERELVDHRAQLLELLPDVLIELDESGAVTSAHAPAGRLVLGQNPATLKQVALDTLVGEQSAELIKNLVAKARSDRTIQSMVLSWPPRTVHSSSTREYEVRIAARPVGPALAVLRDISDRRKLEAQLHLAERLASLGRIAAGVVHEVSNPLTYIHGNLELALEELELLEKDDLQMATTLAPVVELLNEAREGGNRLRGIIEDIGLLARPDATVPQRVDLKSVVRSVVRMLGTSIRKKATLAVHESQVPFVLGSAPRVTQVLTNLLVNALHALPDTRELAQNQIVLSVTGCSGIVTIEVADNGVGIAPEDHARIFEPFFTTKPVGQGMGLGLPISHGIVTSMGGTMVIESRPTGGTVVKVRLPSIDDEMKL